MNGEKPSGCIFCTKPAGDEDRENGIVFRGESCFVILNAYPYNPGHLMVVPYRHLNRVADLEDRELAELMVVTKRAMSILEAAMAPDGLNVGINQGIAAGAGIADHVHQHVVPRWSGDTNFMTTVGNTKVLPEMVNETYEKLAPMFRMDPNGD